MTRLLPDRPDISSLKKQAKKLLRQYRDCVESAIALIKLYHPHPEQFKSLRDAQWIIARSYGFNGWSDLVEAVEMATLVSQDVRVLADKFIDLACVQYNGEDSDLRYDRASRLLIQNPQLSEVNFSTAIISHDLSRVQMLLEKNPELARLNAGPRDWQPLMYLTYNRLPEPAEQKNSLKITHLLLEHGADPDAFVLLNDVYRFTALTGAMGEGENGLANQPSHQYASELASMLLNAGANPNDSQGLYNTMFSDSGDYWLRLLIDYGLNRHSLVNWNKLKNPQSMFDYLLGAAVSMNRLSRVVFLLDQGANANAYCYYKKHTVYKKALLEAHDDIAECLISAGAKPEVLSFLDKFQLSIIKADISTLKQILEQDPELINDPELLKDSNIAVLECLMDYGLDIDQQSDNGNTLLHYFSAKGKIEEVRFLLEQGARTDIRDKVHQGTAVGAAHFNYQYVVRDFLLEHSYSIIEMAACGYLDRLRELVVKDPSLVHQQSISGNTPLHLVCNWLGSKADNALRAEIMDILLEHGANINAKNKQELTPLQLNKLENDEDNINLLIERGAK